MEEVIQDLGELKTLYPGNQWQTFIANSMVQQYFGIADQDTAEYISKLLGTTTISVTAYSENQSTGRTNSDFLSGASGSHNRGNSSGETVSEQVRPLLLPDEVRRLNPSEQLIFIQGRPPIRAELLNYLKNSEFVGL